MKKGVQRGLILSCTPFYSYFVRLMPLLGLLVLSVDGLDFLLHHVEVCLQLLYLAVHFLYEAVALLAGSIED